MMIEISDTYLKTLQPFACDDQIRLTAPSEMLAKLKTIARIKNTSRLDVIRFALSQYIEEQSV
jgi:hypothetical protein